MTAKVTSIEIYTDASGAPALVACAGFVFACDCLGTIRVNLVSGGARKPSKRVLGMVRWAYGKALDDATDDGWRAQNRAMYEVPT